MSFIFISLIIINSMNAEAKTLVYCSEGSPEGFNPQLFSSGTTYDASSVPIYNRLVEFKTGTIKLEPGLAERWDISKDGKIYTFYLRKKVKWQTTKYFKPTRYFNAEDVIFSFERQLDKNNKYHYISGGNYEYFNSTDMPKLINRIEKINDLTVRFHLNHAEAPFLADLGMDFASILSKEYADNLLKLKVPEKLDLNPVGTGPFILEEYQKDSRILYKANPNFWGKKPKIDHLVFSITPDASVRYAKLQKGECQVMAYPNPADIAAMKKNNKINVLHEASLSVGYISFNIQKKPLDQVKVRQALAMAVNKQAIIDAIYQGSGQIAKNLIPPTMWSYNDDVKDYEYNPIKAKKMLKDIGLANGFSIDLWAIPVQRPYNPNARRMAEMIQADWGKIGVKTKIVTFEWGEFLKRARDGEHQAIMAGWTGDSGDPDNFFNNLFSCSAAKDGSNYSRWCYQPFEKQIKLASAESDQNKRIKFYKQAQIIMHEQVPALIIAHSTVYEPVSKKVLNYMVDPLGKHHFEDVDIQS
ncbi:ABC transporter substrate-binding protein [Pantoea sp. Mhis]|uniref:ABC transporter substrate-binding protein n=1 Tax=Pantoea sp. Mhis TaxID=2576759 RepID=UPI00351B8633